MRIQSVSKPSVTAIGKDSSTRDGRTLSRMRQRGLRLAGAVDDFTDPETGKNAMNFPIRRL